MRSSMSGGQETKAGRLSGSSTGYSREQTIGPASPTPDRSPSRHFQMPILKTRPDRTSSSAKPSWFVPVSGVFGQVGHSISDTQAGKETKGIYLFLE